MNFPRSLDASSSLRAKLVRFFLIWDNRTPSDGDLSDWNDIKLKEDLIKEWWVEESHQVYHS